MPGVPESLGLAILAPLAGTVQLPDAVLSGGRGVDRAGGNRVRRQSNGADARRADDCLSCAPNSAIAQRRCGRGCLCGAGCDRGDASGDDGVHASERLAVRCRSNRRDMYRSGRRAARRHLQLSDRHRRAAQTQRDEIPRFWR